MSLGARLGQCEGRCCNTGSVPALLPDNVKFVAEGLRSISRPQASVSSTGSVKAGLAASALEPTHLDAGPHFRWSFGASFCG